jgi:hypothetical protein
VSAISSAHPELRTDEQAAALMEAADRLAGLVGQLDDHMNAGGNPPADWPTPAGRILPAGWPLLIRRAIIAAKLAAGTQAVAMADAIAAEIASRTPGAEIPHPSSCGCNGNGNCAYWNRQLLAAK